jgi:hypothetical protein
MIAFVLSTGAEERAILRARREELSMVPVPLHGTRARDRERSAFQVFEWQRDLMKIAHGAMDGADGMASQRRAEEQAAARHQIRLVALPDGKASARR